MGAGTGKRRDFLIPLSVEDVHLLQKAHLLKKTSVLLYISLNLLYRLYTTSLERKDIMKPR
jgi:hypothetical protein